jgi:hypothetical protein
MREQGYGGRREDCADVNQGAERPFQPHSHLALKITLVRPSAEEIEFVLMSRGLQHLQNLDLPVN